MVPRYSRGLAGEVTHTNTQSSDHILQNSDHRSLWVNCVTPCFVLSFLLIHSLVYWISESKSVTGDVFKLMTIKMEIVSQCDQHMYRLLSLTSVPLQFAKTIFFKISLSFQCSTRQDQVPSSYFRLIQGDLHSEFSMAFNIPAFSFNLTFPMNDKRRSHASYKKVPINFV